MKKLSHKDFIIALGIAVAAIILVTSIYFKETSASNSNNSAKPFSEKKVKPTVMVKKILERLSRKTLL